MPLDNGKTDNVVAFERPANVRLASAGDEEALYTLLMALNEDNSFGVPLSEDRIRAVIRRGIERQHSMIGVIDGADELAGSINLTLGQFWYSDVWHLNEVWLFVKPDYRRNHFDRDLFQFAKWAREAMSKQLGYECQVVTSVSSPKDLDLKLRLWRRHGKQDDEIYV